MWAKYLFFVIFINFKSLRAFIFRANINVTKIYWIFQFLFKRLLTWKMRCNHQEDLVDSLLMHLLRYLSYLIGDLSHFLDFASFSINLDAYAWEIYFPSNTELLILLVDISICFLYLSSILYVFAWIAAWICFWFSW